MLSILHVDPERGWGGGQEQLVELCRYLARRGHHQTVACRHDGALRPRVQGAGIDVCDVSIRNDIDLRPAWQLRRLLRARDFDIVHFQTARAHAMAPWLPRRGSRFVVTRHMDYRPRCRPRVQYLYNRSVDGVIAVSAAIASVLEQAGVARTHIRVIHVGIDCARFEGRDAEREPVRGEWGATATDFVVFTAAVLEPRKGHAVLLDALAGLIHDAVPIRWVICGDGSLQTSLREQVADAGIADRVTFTGFSTDVPRLLSGADAFVLPSRQEGLGIAVMEAMAARLPVVASRIGGVPEIVVDGETGYLVPPGDAPALAGAIRALVANRAQARQLGASGFRRVREAFTSERMARAVEAYYEELLARPAGEA